jgi:hypothetical protein
MEDAQRVTELHAYDFPSSVECDEHRQAEIKRRERRHQARLHKEVRRQRVVLRNELQGRRPPEWQVQQRAKLKITADDQSQVADK